MRLLLTQDRNLGEFTSLTETRCTSTLYSTCVSRFVQKRKTSGDKEPFRPFASTADCSAFQEWPETAPSISPELIIQDMVPQPQLPTLKCV